ncbi:PAS domain-containing protein [Marinobacterium lacunae]|uniref:PAS domain-containing protein n=1 Tax=Marinobacterium lacunae TaxID=1232683 RepID=UPI0018CC1B8C|nr:PAS domain-containing protein [Marinobacterium lacunae]
MQTGYREHELYGQGLSVLLCESASAQLASDIEALKSSSTPHLNLTLALRSKDGCNRKHPLMAIRLDEPVGSTTAFVLQLLAPCTVDQALHPTGALPSSAVEYRDDSADVAADMLSDSVEQATGIRRELIDSLQLAVFEALAKGAPLGICLERVVSYIEQACPELCASVMLVDDHARCLQVGPAPSLPAEYLKAIDGLAIAEGQGSCGTAAYRGQVMAVDDIATHPYFLAYRELALAAGLRACWSQPIIDVNGQVLGVLAIYRRQPGAPGLEHLALVHRASQFTAIAIRRSRAECALRESEERYRQIFDNSKDALFLVEQAENGQYRHIEVNPMLESLLGVPRSRLLGKTVDELAPPDLALLINSKYRLCFQGGRTLDEELEVELPAGRRTFHTTLVPVKGSYGKVHRVVGISRDITERKRAEQLLHAREEAFRALAENSPDGIARYDRLGRCIFINPALSAALMLEDIDACDADDIQRTFEQFDSEYGCQLRRALRKGEETQALIPWRGRDGQWIFSDVRFVPEFDPVGNVVSVLAVGRDVTALKVAEQQLRALADNSPDLIARCDGTSRVLYINRALAGKLRVKNVDAVLGIPISQAFSDTPEYSRLESAVRRVWTSASGGDLELYLPARNEWHFFRLVPESNADGKLSSVLIVGQDVSSQRMRDASLRESQSMLRELAARRESELEAERKRIAREVHDELGQLLTSLRLNLNLLAREFGSAQPELGSRVRLLCTIVDRTIQSVRDIASTLRPPVLDMGIASALEWLVQRFSADTCLQCSLQLDESIELDEARAIMVFRVVQESLTNVARHAKASSVRVSLRRCGGKCQLCVADDGVGFDPKAYATRRSFGLIGMQERALMMGGKMRLDSAPYRGTRIELNIPLEQECKHDPITTG